jgi:hypothetical protein
MALALDPTTLYSSPDDSDGIDGIALSASLLATWEQDTILLSLAHFD